MPKPKVVPFPPSPDDQAAAHLVGPLEDLIRNILAGKVKAYSFAAVTEDGTSFCNRNHPQAELGNMMSLASGLRMAELSIMGDLLEVSGDD